MKELEDMKHLGMFFFPKFWSKNRKYEVNERAVIGRQTIGSVEVGKNVKGIKSIFF